MTGVRASLAALAVIVLAAHLAFLSPTLEDIDSINFALGVRHFDVAQHQPHPPGAPVFVALGKITTPLFRAAGVHGAESRALAIWSIVSAAAAVPLVFVLFSAMGGDRRAAFWAAALAACAPLAWFTAARPMTDMTGLALALAAQALAMRAWSGRGGTAGLAGSGLLAGLAAGVRIQTAALTVPLLFVAALSRTAAGVRCHLAPCRTGRGDRMSLAGIGVAAVAALAGVLLWAIPLVLVSGGPSQYLVALGSQAGEDFEWVRMVWKSPTNPRVVVHALVNSFAWPWGWLWLGAVAAALSGIGLVWAAWKSPRALMIFLVAFAPYTIFHFLFQETTTMRYALPVVVPMAYLIVRAAEVFRLSPFIEIGVVAASLVFAVPETRAFGQGSPALGAVTDAVAHGGTMTGHAGMHRLWVWLDTGDHGVRFEKTPHGYEWLTLVDHWQKNPDAPAQFLANPKRTEHLSLFDPQARQQVVEYRWSFPEWPMLGGARPGAVTRVLFAPPGWMLDRGWAISAEIAGITEKEGYGPHRKPSVAWVRGRSDATTIFIGGRHLGAAGDPEAHMTMELNGVTQAMWNVKPGFFTRIFELPAGAFTGIGYLGLQFKASAEGGTPPRVSLEQFDLQPAGVPMLGLLDGWQEPEYDRTMGRAWRWMSDRAELWVRPVGRDVVVTLRGASPMNDFDAPPTLRAMVNGREIATLSPRSDFRWEIPIRAADLSPDGRITIESDKHFVPGEREGTADRRRLAVRVFSAVIR